MSRHAVVRHTLHKLLGTASEDSMPHMRSNGWVRVSEYTDRNPAVLNPSDYADAPDLDAPATEPAPAQPDEPSTDETEE